MSVFQGFYSENSVAEGSLYANMSERLFRGARGEDSRDVRGRAGMDSRPRAGKSESDVEPAPSPGEPACPRILTPGAPPTIYELMGDSENSGGGGIALKRTREGVPASGGTAEVPVSFWAIPERPHLRTTVTSPLRSGLSLSRTLRRNVSPFLNPGFLK
jgi:hypothetical protein